MLLDSEPLYAQAESDIIGDHGDVHTITPKLLGRTPRDSARIVIDSFHLPMSVDEYLSRRNERLLEILPACELLEGAEDIVNCFAKHNVKMSIATSSPRPLLELKMKVHPKLFEPFKGKVVCTDDVEHGKPHPDIFLKAAELMKSSPANCIVFEDSPAGIKGARMAQMRCIAIANKTVSDEEYKSVGADFVLHSWKEYDPLRLEVDLPKLP